MITAQSADGTQHQFPDGTDPGIVDKVMKSYAQQSAGTAQQTGPQPTMMDKVRNIGGGLEQGIYDIPQSIAELGARGLDATGLTNSAYKTLHEGFDMGNNKPAPGAEGYFKGGRIGGQILATAPLSGVNVLKGAGLAARAANGAMQGAAAAGLTSNSSDAPLTQQIGMGVLGGAALPAAGLLLKAGGKAAIGALGEATGAGAASIRNAFQAGKAGGDASQAFTGSMRGDTPWSQVVADAKGALANMRAARGAAYRSGMADVSKDATVLDFAPVDQAIAKTNAVQNYKGVDLSPKTAEVRQEVADTVNQWKGLDPAEYHTPEGFDALKQKLGGIRDSYQYGTPERLVADNAYNAVRSSIAQQAPAYDKVMSGYSKASEELDAIQREMSLKPNANPNTALRKLQSVMRDNANTSWGDRSKYADRLADAGASNLLPSLAGQALSTVVPRGLAKYADAAAMGVAALHNPALLAALPLASPRVVGELAHGAGKMSGMFGRIPLQVPAVPGLGIFSPAMGAAAPLLLQPRR